MARVPVKRFEIYLAELQFRKSKDKRPVIILRPPIQSSDSPETELVQVAPISSQFDMFDRSKHFVIDDRDLSFEDTGLKHKSYIIANYPSHIDVNDLVKKKGRLAGDMLDQFRFWLPAEG